MLTPFVNFLNRQAKPFTQGSGRQELAERIAAPDNPLTARVMVNRIWMRLVGASLVESPSDFGMRCSAPIQQDVLDHLAVDFIANDWSLKSLIRRMVHSAVYRQSTTRLIRQLA